MTQSNQAGDVQTVNTLETFGFLPKLTQEEVYSQIAYILGQGWTPAIEHEDPNNSTDHFWAMWKLPLFGEQSLENVVGEIEACRRAYPDHHVRLLGYDNYTQSQGLAFVVHEGTRR